ncbi:MFS transporter [Acidovorax sp. M2(2025)]|uniref:MFS transporter n=1 Tax=Acidovorax sp. M2(2025) TaxID=3411355 RepID=UPI003BF60743
MSPATAAAAAHAAPAALTARAGLAYGLLGLPLAFVALPLYVLLPNHYARAFGMPLATLGAVLLAARLFDAFTDPLLGRLSDHLFGRSPRAVLRAGAVSAAVLALGLGGLLFPPVQSPSALVAWAPAALVVTYAAYSQLGIAHQAWGARLGGDEVQRSRIVGWREAAALVGVVLASVLPSWAGLPALWAAFAVALAAGWWAWTRAPRPAPDAATAALPGVHDAPGRHPGLWRPWGQAAFRRLLLVFVLNGTASAIPATLVLFFVQDGLQAPAAQEPLFLGAYFLCAALSIPLWLRAVARWGLARTWLAGMMLAVAAFSWTAGLSAGDARAFLAVCALSGVALGTDLALPGALLAGVVAAGGDAGRHEGAYFGWWNFATKLNLALAAGLALPLLGWLGYTPGTRSAQGLQVLAWAYAVLPCALKLLAAAALYGLLLRPQRGRAAGSPALSRGPF